MKMNVLLLTMMSVQSIAWSDEGNRNVCTFVGMAIMPISKCACFRSASALVAITLSQTCDLPTYRAVLEFNAQ